LLEPLFGHARRIARGLEMALALDGTFVAINNGVGQSVPHLHVHVIPRRKDDGMRDLYMPRKDFADENERENLVRTLSQYMASFPD
jgi:histidine triad (HIT) family protein